MACRGWHCGRRDTQAGNDKNDNNESYSLALVKQAIFERQIYTIVVKR